MTFETRLEVWHRRYTELELLRQRLDKALATPGASEDIKRLQRQLDWLEQGCAESIKEVQQFMAADRDRSQYWMSSTPAADPLPGSKREPRRGRKNLTERSGRRVSEKAQSESEQLVSA